MYSDTRLEATITATISTLSKKDLLATFNLLVMVELLTRELAEWSSFKLFSMKPAKFIRLPMSTAHRLRLEQINCSTIVQRICNEQPERCILLPWLEHRIYILRQPFLPTRAMYFIFQFFKACLKASNLLIMFRQE